ncbi:DMT family transporter [Rhodoligotrophos ferricapiens]|uniref:DMT family transporter n=1 Tax=Rhodoligotrophos ferricapiens TaxID=3069264 RepID=UPI00315DB6D2
MPSEKSSQPSWLRLAPGLFVFLWSTGFIGAKFGLPYAEPFTFLSLRFALTVVLLMITAVILRLPRPAPREALHGMTTGVLVHGIYLGTVFWTISRGMPAGISALIVGLQPLITSLLARFIGERLTWRNWAGLALGLLGVAMVIWPKLNIGDQGVSLEGLGMLFIGILSISIGSIYQKRFTGQSSLVTGTACQFAGALVISMVCAILFERFAINPTAEFVFALGWMVVVLSIGAISLFTLLLRYGNVSKVAGLFYLVPASTAILAYLLFGETLNLLQIAGMVVCMAGVALVSQRR